MSDEYLVTFEGKIATVEFNQFVSTVVYLPQKFHRQLPLKANPRLRTKGFIDNIPFELALQPTGKNRWYLMLAKRLTKLLNKRVGDTIVVMLDIADQDHVSVPKELEHALFADDQAKRVWESLTPGKRRGMAHRVVSAKRADTKEKRVLEILEELVGI